MTFREDECFSKLVRVLNSNLPLTHKNTQKHFFAFSSHTHITACSTYTHNKKKEKNHQIAQEPFPTIKDFPADNRSKPLSGDNGSPDDKHRHMYASKPHKQHDTYTHNNITPPSSRHQPHTMTQYPQEAIVFQVALFRLRSKISSKNKHNG